MGLFKNIIGNERRAMIQADRQTLELLGIDVNGIDSNKLKEVTYFTCLRILSDTISKLPIKLMKKDKKGANKQVNHYLYNLIKLRPNQYMSSSDFFKSVEFQRNHFGNSVVYIDFDRKGKIKGLYPLDMNKVTILVDDKGIIDRDNAVWYIVQGNDFKQYKFKAGEVLHFKGLTINGIEGISIGEYLSTLIESSKAGQQYVNNYFKGGLFAKGILQYTGDISTENIGKLKRKFESMAGGVDNAGSVLPLPLGFEFKSLKNTMADSQFMEINQLSARQIASAFGIKMHMLNDLDRATHTNIAEQQKSFYIDTLQSILNMYEQEMTYKLLLKKEVEQGYFWKFNVDSILRSDLKARYESYAKGIQNGFLKPNEVRKMEDLPIEEDGDILMANGNMLPLSMVGSFYRDKYENDNNNKPSDKGGDEEDE